MTADPAELDGAARLRAADREQQTPPLEWCGLVSPRDVGRRLPTPPAGWWRLQPPAARPAGPVDPGAPARWGPGSSSDGRAPGSAFTAGRGGRGLDPPPRDRPIFDLCAGSGAWSEPYALAGYIVVRVTLPATDVRTWAPPCRPWGIIAAPPCNEFSRAKRDDRDYVEGMACVNACLRIIAQCRPRWWALENPQHGDLSQFLGLPTWTFQPHHFGDPWTKATALWGEFSPPLERADVEPQGSAMDRRTSAARAVTPPGFARAFFAANP